MSSFLLCSLSQAGDSKACPAAAIAKVHLENNDRGVRNFFGDPQSTATSHGDGLVLILMQVVLVASNGMMA